MSARNVHVVYAGFNNRPDHADYDEIGYFIVPPLPAPQCEKLARLIVSDCVPRTLITTQIQPNADNNLQPKDGTEGTFVPLLNIIRPTDRGQRFDPRIQSYSSLLYLSETASILRRADYNRVARNVLAIAAITDTVVALRQQ